MVQAYMLRKSCDLRAHVSSASGTALRRASDDSNSVYCTFECERSSARARAAQASSRVRVRALECSSTRAPFIEFHTFKLASTIARTRRSRISST